MPQGKPVTWCVAAASLAAVAVAPAAAERGLVFGLWLTDTRDGVVEMQPCGDRLCARVHAILDPKIPRSAVDVFNERPDLRTRPICGLPIMGNLQPQGKATWGNGWVYDPKVGKTYDVEVTLRDPQTLVVHGYIGVKLIGRTVTWTRPAQAVPRCTTPVRS
jgi:uncharacterized protein (DUF2147 family)